MHFGFETAPRIAGERAEAVAGRFGAGPDVRSSRPEGESFEGVVPREDDPSRCDAAWARSYLSCGLRAIRACLLPPCWRLAGRLGVSGSVRHLVLHMNTTPDRGKDDGFIGRHRPEDRCRSRHRCSFDGSRLILRFLNWKPNAKGNFLEYKVASCKATVGASGTGLTGVWTQEGSWPLNFNHLIWPARNPKPAPPAIFHGDWAVIEEEGGSLEVHFILPISNTEDGLMIFLDCPDEKFKGARASKVACDQVARQFSFRILNANLGGRSLRTTKLWALQRAHRTIIFSSISIDCRRKRRSPIETIGTKRASECVDATEFGLRTPSGRRSGFTGDHHIRKGPSRNGLAVE